MRSLNTYFPVVGNRCVKHFSSDSVRCYGNGFSDQSANNRRRSDRNKVKNNRYNRCIMRYCSTKIKRIRNVPAIFYMVFFSQKTLICVNAEMVLVLKIVFLWPIAYRNVYLPNRIPCVFYGSTWC